MMSLTGCPCNFEGEGDKLSLWEERMAFGYTSLCPGRPYIRPQNICAVKGLLKNCDQFWDCGGSVAVALAFNNFISRVLLHACIRIEAK